MMCQEFVTFVVMGFALAVIIYYLYSTEDKMKDKPRCKMCGK